MLDTKLICNRLKAASGTIAINSPNILEDQLLTRLLIEVAQERKYVSYHWDIDRGLSAVTLTFDKEKQINGNQKRPLQTETGDKHGVSDLLDFISACQERALFVICNIHEFLPNGMTPNVLVLQGLLNLCNEIKHSQKRLILTGNEMHLSHHFDGVVFELDNPLPTETERSTSLELRLQDIRTQNKTLPITFTEHGKRDLIRALGGITREEADDLLLLASIANGRLNDETAQFVNAQRTVALRKKNLELILPTDMVRSVGMEALDEWLVNKQRMFEPTAQEYGLDYPKGILLLGPPGTGKTLTAENLALLWHLPILKMNIGQMMSSALGGSERNMRRLLAAIENLHLILLIDEIDKQFAAIAKGSSASSDGGASQRVFSNFLEWMGEKAKRRIPVFVVATANRIDHLPPEMLRDGRWDGKFYVGLPAAAARQAILKIHLERRLIKLPDEDIATVADITEGFSGAELEQQVVVKCAERAYIEDRPSQVTVSELLQAANSAVIQSRDPEIRQALEAQAQWAEQNAMPVNHRTAPQPFSRAYLASEFNL